MAFWGVELKPGKPFSLKSPCADATQISRRLHISQATLGLGSSTLRTTVQCNVGSRSPLFLCALSSDKVYSCPLSIEFAESDTVVFSVIGPGTVHLTGYFLPKTSSAYRLNDDESESYGEDIVESDAEKRSSDDYDYSDSFINDDEPTVRASHLSTSDSDDQISIKEMAAKSKDKINNGKGRRLRKKYLVCDSASEENSVRDDNLSSGDSLQLLEKPHSEECLQSSGEGNDTKVLSLENPLPSPTHTNTPEKMEDEPMAEVEEICETPSTEKIKEDKPLAEVEEICETPTKEKREEGCVVADTEGKTTLASDEEDSPLGELEKSCETPSKNKRKEESDVADRVLETVQNEKPATDSEDKPLGDVEKICETPSKKKRKGRSAVVNSDDRTMPESVQNEKPAADEEDKSLGEVEKSCETPSKKKKKGRSVVVNSDDRTMPETLENEIPASDMEIKTTSDVLPPQNGDAAVAKKKRKRDGKEDDNEGKKSPSKPEKKKKKKKKKEAINKNTTEEASSEKPMEPELPSNEVTIEEIAKGNLDGKSAVRGRKVSILYSGKLKETGEFFDIKYRDVPFRHRLGGAELIEGLTIGIEGMRVGDKRRLIIPPSLRYADEGLGDSVPKNAWLVYEVEAVKVR